MDVLVALEPEAGADAEETGRLGQQLHRELRSLDADVLPVASGPAPAGAKGVDAVSTTQLLLTLGGTGGVIATLVATVRDWLGRRSGSHKITLTIDGDTLELDRATADQRAELIDVFVRRHEPG